MRRVVDLPQPDGPTSDDELAILDLEVDAVDDLGVAVTLHNLVERKVSHGQSPFVAEPAACVSRSISVANRRSEPCLDRDGSRRDVADPPPARHRAPGFPPGPRGAGPPGSVRTAMKYSGVTTSPKRLFGHDGPSTRMI